jgi:hypothetical protein
MIAGDEINVDVLKNLRKKGQHYIYQDAEAYKLFMNSKFKNIKSKLKDASVSDEKKVQLQLATIKEVQNAVKLMGISDTVINVTNDVVDSVEDMIKGKVNLRSIVKDLLSHKSSFFTRSSIMNYLLGSMTMKLGWDTKSTLKKLVFSSVFCDFAFDDSQGEIANILTLDDPRIANLNKTQLNILKSHPEIAAAKISKMEGMLVDERAIIANHHEKPDGSGFPKGLGSTKIPPLSCAFILAYDFTIKLINDSSDPTSINTKELLEALGEDYRKGGFEKPYKALKSALQIDIVQE